MYISQQNVYIAILPQQGLRAVRRRGVHVGGRERGVDYDGRGGHAGSVTGLAVMVLIFNRSSGPSYRQAGDWGGTTARFE
jgi:hypothetical protein